MRVTVKHGPTPHPLDLPAAATGADLAAAVEAVTGVPARNQKLVCKGRVVGASLAGVGDGATLLLLATGGAAPPTAGAAAALAARAARDRADAAAVKPARVAGGEEGGDAAAAADAARARGWAATGVVALRGRGLAALPAAVWTVGAAATAVDVGGNALTSLDARCAAAWPRVARLRADHNALAAPPPALPPGLTALDLGFNPGLRALPAAVAALPSLARLSLAACGLTALGPSIGALTRLTDLDLADNALTGLPDELASCVALVHVDARRNRIVDLPASLGRAGLPALTALQLDGNRVSSLPAGILTACSRLCDLGLADNPITAAALRAADGFDAFDARRVAAANRRLAARVDPGGDGFRATADEERWARHAGRK